MLWDVDFCTKIDVKGFQYEIMGKVVCDGMQNVRDATVHPVILRMRGWLFIQEHLVARWETVCNAKYIFASLWVRCNCVSCIKIYVNGAIKKMGKALCAMQSVILHQGASKRCNCASCGERWLRCQAPAFPQQEQPCSAHVLNFYWSFSFARPILLLPMYYWDVLLEFLNTCGV